MVGRRAHGQLKTTVLALLRDSAEPVSARMLLERWPAAEPAPAFTTVRTVLTRLQQAGRRRARRRRRGPVPLRHVAGGIAAESMLAALLESSDRGAALMSFAEQLTRQDLAVAAPRGRRRVAVVIVPRRAARSSPPPASSARPASSGSRRSPCSGRASSSPRGSRVFLLGAVAVLGSVVWSVLLALAAHTRRDGRRLGRRHRRLGGARRRPAAPRHSCSPGRSRTSRTGVRRAATSTCSPPPARSAPGRSAGCPCSSCAPSDRWRSARPATAAASW